MAPSSPERLRAVRKFEDLVKYLEDELDWPLGDHPFEDLTFEYSAQELGLKDETIADGTKIRQLRPLKTGQPWGIFFVEFPKKRLPVLVLRRILHSLVIKKRASSQRSKTAAWDAKDLLFISAFGDEAGGEREIAFGHFHEENGDKPVLRVLDWDGSDTPLKLARLDDTLRRKLAWPQQGESPDAWRDRWSSAFRLRLNHVIKTSDRMADVLANFARGIRQKVLAGLLAETDKGPLHLLLEDFRKSLLHDLKEADFADTYAQTVTYGLLSLAITKTQAGQPKTVSAGHLISEVPLTSPFLKEILGELLKRGGRKGGLDYDELGLHEVVEFLNADETDLPAILADFGNKTAADDPVIHFYEHFLSAYDRKLKIQRGVFYTPRPVVSYIVRSVHEILQTEFDLVDGLADTATWGWMAKRHPGLAIPDAVKPTDRFVTVLDPATGTATFLVEVIDVIYRTLMKKWQGEGHSQKKCTEMWNAYVPEHLLPRLYGYELLMAPYAIAHLKIGLKLTETGYAFGSPAVARVFLTNALEPASERKLVGLGLMALAHEAEAVNAVKREQRFTVVIGNPPYSNFGQLNKNPFIMALLEDYKRGLNEKKLNLDDDFIKFVRFSEALIAAAGVGVHGMVTNNAYLDGITHRRMRRRIQTSFPRVVLTNLHGSSKKKEKAPDGTPDKNVFDITVGVAIGVFSRPPQTDGTSVVYADLWGERDQKIAALNGVGRPISWRVLDPTPDGHFFVPKDFSREQEYGLGWSIRDIFGLWQNGLKTDRDELFFDFESGVLEKRIQAFYAPRLDPDFRERYQIVSSSSYDIETRRLATRFSKTHIRECLYRPLDTRWLYYDTELTSRPAEKVMRHMLAGSNIGLIATRQTQETWSVLATDKMCGHKSCAAYDINSLFPLYVYESALAFDSGGESTEEAGVLLAIPNLTPGFLKALATSLRVAQKPPHGLPDGLTAADIFHYAYAVFHSPGYVERYAEFLRIEFPRLPLPGGSAPLRALAGLGKRLVALHLLDMPDGAAGGPEYDGPIAPEIRRVGWQSEVVWLDAGAVKNGHATKPGTIAFRGVPEAVWEFHIGGYQVCEQWLDDRKGRTLSAADITHYQRIVIAISETIRLMKEIDGVIDSLGGWPGAFQKGEVTSAETATIPFPRRVNAPQPKERYGTCLPLVALKVAAGAFSDPQHIDDDDFEWVAVDARHALRRGMFVAQVVGKSMEPAIPDGAFCLFAAPVEGTRQGKTVLVQLRDRKDPETGERYTVKRYESEKVPDEESWRHARITLKPANRDFAAIELTGGEGDLTVIAEFLEVLGKPNAAERG